MLEKIYNKYGRKKVYLSSAILLIIVNIVTMFIVYRVNTSFTINGQKFRYVSDKRNSVLFKDSEGNEVNILIEERGGSKLFDIMANRYQITYKDETINVDFTNWFQDGVSINTSSGRDYELGYSEYLTYYNNEYGSFDVKLVYKTNSAYSIAKDKTDILLMIFAIFPLIFLGLALIIYPEKLWRFNYMFTVRGGEPTEWAIFSSKLGGIIIIIFTLLSPLFALRR